MQKKIKIVHLVNDLSPAGKEVGILKLLRHLDNRLFDTCLVVFRGIEDLDEIDLNQFNIFCLNKRQGNDFYLPFKLASFFRRYKPDIVHTHAWGTLVEGILGAKLSRIPIIIHGEHGTFPQAPLHRFIQRFFWNRSDVVLSVSGNLKDKLSQIIGFPPHKMQVILNGVESDKFFPSQQLRESFRCGNGFSSEDFIVGTVGRFIEVKNHAMLIKAVAGINHNGESIQLVLVGDGEKKGEMEEQVKQLNIKENVHFLGYRDDVNLILNGMDVFTLTSFSEGCSNVIQEAMFAGKPVIATDVGGNPELVKTGLNGYLVQSNDFKGLADKIMLLKKERELSNKLGTDALKFANENFSLTAMIDQYSELYLKLYQEKVKLN